MGRIDSDFFTDFTRIDTMEPFFTSDELLRMASMDVQEEYAGWLGEDDDLAGYIPGEVLTALLSDRAFFADMMQMRDTGEYVVMSGVTLGISSVHNDKLGLSEEDASDNIVSFFENEETVMDCIRSMTNGMRARISALYVFGNGWYGVETEVPAEVQWEEEGGEPSPGGEIEYEPSTSYIFSDEGELVATPDLSYNLDAWMDFVDMFSAVHEEATAVEDKKAAAKDEKEAGNSYIVFSPEVEEAMEEGRGIVVIESAATFGGMIYPGIADFAFRMRNTIRENGATPAFVAIIQGKIHVGLTDDEIRYLETKRGKILKAASRDIPILLAMHADAVVTIAGAVVVASMVGFTVACGSGIGGVQIGAEKTMDISTDLPALAQNTVMVVCSGTKPLLDLEKTMEYLETASIPVIGYGTDRMPEYMARGSGHRLTYRMDSPADLALVMKIKAKMGIEGGILVVNPVPQEHELDQNRTRQAVDAAIHDVEKNHVKGKTASGYMMGRLRESLGNDGAEAQKAFLINNAVLAAKIAVEMHK